MNTEFPAGHMQKFLPKNKEVCTGVSKHLNHRMGYWKISSELNILIRMIRAIIKKMETTWPNYLTQTGCPLKLSEHTVLSICQEVIQNPFTSDKSTGNRDRSKQRYNWWDTPLCVGLYSQTFRKRHVKSYLLFAHNHFIEPASPRS